MKSVIGAFLIDAPFSALNNSGINKRSQNENEIETKVIQSPEGKRPYVSAQAVRYWWRTVLENKFSWNCSPVERIKENQAVTKGNPFEYDDDDIFGYMSARKVDTEEKDKYGKQKKEDVTVTRISPLKCSPLIGFPTQPALDFGVLRRKLEGPSIIFMHQFYSNILKGIFAIDVDSVGKYTTFDKPGSRNLSKDLISKYDSYGYRGIYEIPRERKRKRISDVVKALKYLNGGAMQALHLTDVTPKLIILTVLNGGNNIFMNVIPHNRYAEGLVNIDALYEVLEDYRGDILSKVYIGKFSGFGTEADEELENFKAPSGIDLVITTPAKAIDQFADEILTSDKIVSE
jgi:CRISPR-associated protein Cst2